jgi:phosphatidate cytidylyltransferase
MAFNLQTFKTRTLTAVVFAAVMLTGLLWNHWSFLVLFSIIHFGCWWEYFNLLEKIYKTVYNLNTRFGLMLMGFAIILWFCGNTFTINGYRLSENFALPVSAAGFVLLSIGIFQTTKINLKAVSIAALGLVYISLCWGLMVQMYQGHQFQVGDSVIVSGPAYIPLLIIVSIWINDTMAYIVGSLIGKTPLSKISPKKTWEGTVGGILLSSALMFFLWNQLAYSINEYSINLMTGIIALIAAITGTLGDLLESKLKRMADVKDSGSFMPGHGGFLDRFDSLLIAIPAVWIFVSLFIR